MSSRFRPPGVRSLPLPRRGYRQYSSSEAAAIDHATRIRRLVRKGALSPTTPLLRCGQPRCGFASAEDADASCSPSLDCPAVCRIAHAAFERQHPRTLARLLKEVDERLLTVTVINPRYWLPLDEFPTFSTNAFKQSLARGLSKLPPRDARHPVLATGRIDFDLAGDPDNLIVRPHTHFVVVNSRRDGIERHLKPRFNPNEHPHLAAVNIRPVIDIGAFRYATKCMLKGLSKDERVPVDLIKSRSRPPAYAEQVFDAWLSRRQVSDLLVLHGIRRSGRTFRRLE